MALDFNHVIHVYVRAILQSASSPKLIFQSVTYNSDIWYMPKYQIDLALMLLSTELIMVVFRCAVVIINIPLNMSHLVELMRHVKL